jgi:excisionase family DNA binding protein
MGLICILFCITSVGVRHSKVNVQSFFDQGGTMEATEPTRRVVTVQEAGAILQISRGAAYQAAKTKQLPTIRIGRRLLVPVAALERMLSGNTADGPAKAA